MGIITAIGGGFYTWGQFNLRLDNIEKKKVKSVNIAPLQESIATLTTKVDSLEGDLMIFKGNKSIHQVTAVEEGERVLVTFNYNEVEGIPLSEQSRKTFFGRIK